MRKRREGEQRVCEGGEGVRVRRGCEEGEERV